LPFNCTSIRWTDSHDDKLPAVTAIQSAALIASIDFAMMLGVIMPTDAAMPRLSFAIRLLFACCLFAATANHIHADALHGFLWDYGYGRDARLVSRIFWGALTLFDPVAALLLFIKPKVGIALTAAIILIDVAHNTFYVALKQQWLERFYLSQVAFLIVVFLLAPVAWRGLNRDRTIGG